MIAVPCLVTQDKIGASNSGMGKNRCYYLRESWEFLNKEALIQTAFANQSTRDFQLKNLLGTGEVKSK